MAKRKVLQYPREEARLRRKSAPVKRLDKDTKALIQDMRETLAGLPGAGLSAVQIGVHQRISLVGLGQDEGEMQPPIVLINPEIIERGPLISGFDGCLSIIGLVTWDTPRPEWLVFRARDENWQPYEMRVEGIDARVVDHEFDHLEGRLFLDLMGPGMRLYHSETDENGEERLVEISGPSGS